MAPAPSLRSRIAASAAALGLLAALACGGGKGGDGSSPQAQSATVQGKVTYTRIPLAKDANGIPTGLDTAAASLQTLPARGLVVAAYSQDATSGLWSLKDRGTTDTNGHYTLALPPSVSYVIQLQSTEQPFSGSSVNLIADPNGLGSTVPEPARVRYLLRKAPDGTAAAAGNLTPASVVAAQGTYTADFAVDLSTTWLTGSLEVAANGTYPGFASAAFEASATGSRPLAILDDVYAFASTYGDPTLGGLLDLHYAMGRSESRGTYIEYDRAHWVQPSGIDLAFDSQIAGDHIFGSVRGAASNDDAWDEAVLFQTLGRAYMQNQMALTLYGGTTYQLPPVQAPIDGLTPDMALVEGMPAALAANLLKSPYLADTDGTSALVGAPADVRDLSGVAAADKGPYSARTLAAAAWEIGLKANGIASPGTSTNWATIAPAAIARIFKVAVPTDTTTSIRLYSPAHIYAQLALLKNAKAASEPVDLSAIFNDTTINAVASPFNLPWPQPSTTVFGQSWTSAPPTGAVGAYSYSGTLSMSSDTVQVNGAYPNESYKEVVYLGVSQVNDQAYQLSLATTPSPLPAGATIQVTILNGTSSQAYTFSGSATSSTVFTLTGNGNTTTPLLHPILVRLLSPATAQADIPFTLTLAPAPNGTLRGPAPLR